VVATPWRPSGLSRSWLRDQRRSRADRRAPCYRPKPWRVAAGLDGGPRSGRRLRLLLARRRRRARAPNESSAASPEGREKLGRDCSAPNAKVPPALRAVEFSIRAAGVPHRRIYDLRHTGATGRLGVPSKASRARDHGVGLPTPASARTSAMEGRSPVKYSSHKTRRMRSASRPPGISTVTRYLRTRSIVQGALCG
jgi:hypothetical protein